jgi:hypothetical protein
VRPAARSDEVIRTRRTATNGHNRAERSRQPSDASRIAYHGTDRRLSWSNCGCSYRIPLASSGMFAATRGENRETRRRHPADPPETRRSLLSSLHSRC